MIRYTVSGVLDPGGIGAGKKFASASGEADFSAPSVFYWNVIAPGGTTRSTAPRSPSRCRLRCPERSAPSAAEWAEPATI